MFENANELREALFSVNEIVGNYCKTRFFEEDSNDSYFWRFNENGIIVSLFKNGCITESLVSFEDILSEANDEYAVYLKLKKKFESKSSAAETSKTHASSSVKPDESSDSEMKLTKKESISGMFKSSPKTTLVSTGSSESTAEYEDDEAEIVSEDTKTTTSAISAPKKKKEVSASIRELFSEEETSDPSEVSDEGVNEEADAKKNDKTTDDADDESDNEFEKSVKKRKRTPNSKKRFTSILNFVCKVVKDFDDNIEISEDTRIDELNLNDFDRVEFFCSIENHYDVAIDSDSVKTIKDICDIIFSETE